MAEHPLARLLGSVPLELALLWEIDPRRAYRRARVLLDTGIRVRMYPERDQDPLEERARYVRDGWTFGEDVPWHLYAVETHLRARSPLP